MNHYVKLLAGPRPAPTELARKVLANERKRRMNSNIDPLKDEVGHVYGLLVVEDRIYLPGERKAHWICYCECGNRCIVQGGNLRKGFVQSCGCLKRRQRGMH